MHNNVATLWNIKQIMFTNDAVMQFEKPHDRVISVVASDTNNW